VRAGDYALPGLCRERRRFLALREVLGHDPPGPPRDQGLVVVAVAGRGDEPAVPESLEALGEVRDHVAAVHLAVDQDVETELLLQADPLRGRLALEVGELARAELPAGVLVAGLREVVGLAERPDG